MYVEKAIRVVCVAIALLCLYPAPQGNAQSVVTGELTGTVTDPSAAFVPNANVTVKNDAGEVRTDTSNGAGEFRFALLRPGNYTLTVMAVGFAKTEQPVSIDLGQAKNVAVQLQLEAQPGE